MQTSRDSITNDFSVEVNLVGQNLDPVRITEIIGQEPSKAAKSGDPIRNGQNDHTYETGFWSYESSSTDDVNECRDHQLMCVADMLAPHAEALRGAGVERIYFYYTLSSFVGLMNIHFKAETMKKLSFLDADLHVTCFDCFNPNHSIWNEEGSLETVSTDNEG